MNASLPDPDIVYQSSAVIVLNKPGGVLTQAPPGIDSVELRLKQWLQRTGDSKHVVGCLHRLDRPVSGLLAFGLNRTATRKIAAQFESREVRKMYWAVVSRSPAESSGRWIDFMRKVPDEPRSELVPADHPDAREAILNFSVGDVVTAGESQLCWLQIGLETGRTHQIRLQASTNLASVLGDELYGSSIPFGPQTDDLRKRCIALHARELQFFDPGTRATVRLVGALPQCWNELAVSIPGLAQAAATAHTLPASG